MDEAPLRRGLVLLALHAQYPMALMEAALERQVMPFYGNDRRALGRDLAYLDDKGLLQATEQAVGGRTLRSFTITVDGVDVVDGTVQVPGVTIAAAG